MTDDADPGTGSLLDEVAKAAESLTGGPIGERLGDPQGGLSDAASAIWDALDGGADGGASGGGESGGGGSTDPWDLSGGEGGGGGSTDPWSPLTPAQDPNEPMFVLPPDLAEIITGQKDPDDPSID